MAERFKLKLSRAIPISRVIPSLQICRPKDPSAFVHTPVPVIYRLSPVNSKVFDISIPNNFPSPPPTTPEGHFIKRHVSTTTTSKVVSLSCRKQELYSSEWSFRSPECTWKKDQAARCHVVSKDDHDHESKYDKKKTMTSVLSRDSGCFSCEEDESDQTLISSSTRSVSNYSSTELGHSPECTTTDGENGRKKKKVSTNIKKIRRHRRKASMEYKESDMTVAAGDVSPVKASVFRRKIPGTVDGKVRESVAVVKKSVDPYEDFKRSMLEMILQKQMFDAKDLEQLLLCFLSLNSRKYHEIIVRAFSDIWEILFCD